MKIKSSFQIFIVSILIILVHPRTVQAQNLLDMQGWVVGQGASGTFSISGTNSENIREWGDGPQGKRVIVWRSKPDGTPDRDGGWVSAPFAINHTNMYRFTVWIKKTNSMDGYSYFGCNYVSNLAGVSDANPYFWYGKLPELNKWYLLVGYIHGSGDVSTVNYGGIYDGITGVKVINTTDFKFAVGATQTNHRSYLSYDQNLNDQQYFYAPRIDLVNGNEPTITTLLDLQGGSSELAYFPGKVGIKTSTTGDYELAVKGKIRAQEIKVETANWPDYVFEDDYKSKTLPELEQFIKLNKHLPDMPSAKLAEANGIELGEMNRKLLQKIEELTLHLINERKVNQDRLKEQEDKINSLINRLNKIEKN